MSITVSLLTHMAANALIVMMQSDSSQTISDMNPLRARHPSSQLSQTHQASVKSSVYMADGSFSWDKCKFMKRKWLSEGDTR